MLVGAGKRGARVVRSLGRPDVARDVIEGLMLDRGLQPRVPARRGAEAGGRGGGPDAADAARDLTALPTFTIDPDDARTSTTRSPPSATGRRVRLWVHIADVSRLRAPRRARSTRGAPAG